MTGDPAVEEGLGNQRAAADPANSVWVVANAGAGKTYVLTSRIVRLLLAGARPSAILCLTFTKAAAAEMRDRLSRLLASWATADDAALEKALRDRLGRRPAADEAAKARTLFATVIDAPGALRIQTIHSFCEGLLKRFPVEAGVPPHFAVADDATGNELVRAAREALIADANSDPALGAALAEAARAASESGLGAEIDGLLAARRRMRRLLDAVGGDADAACAAIRRTLGVDGDATRADVFAAHVAAGDAAALAQAVDVLAKGSASETQIAAKLAAARTAADPEDAIASWLSAFLTGEGEPRKRLTVKATQATAPQVEAVLRAEQARCPGLQDRLMAIEIAARSCALFRLGAGLLARYAELKRARALLDYDDLILRAVALLKGAVPWVLYKLDGGIDHVLVDEAQDTAPEQWAAVAAIVDEFFAGEGARVRAPARSVFVVGDEKQSIFSFQGADLEAFERTRGMLRAKAAAAWKEVPLEMSFRSAPVVLEIVDRTFADARARDGVVGPGRTLRHRAIRGLAGGRVELWAPEIRTEPDDADAWEAPVDYVSAEHPSVRLAGRIAATVAGWIGREHLPARGRFVRAGDVLVLVRRRNRFFDACVRAFKDAGVPVAGADRMVLADQIAVMDMLSLARFCLLPADDLALAEVLKSPLYGLDDDDLFALAWNRTGPLWRVLRARAAERPAWEFAAAELALLLGRADFTGPYELFAWLLDARGGRRRMLARLGPDAADPLDEFLAACLADQRAGAPSLQGFLARFEAGAGDIKRDMEQGRDEVRVMTVHGAKGLEADIVFLPDSCALPQQRGGTVWTDPAAGAGVPLWPASGMGAQTQIAAARLARAAREMAEYRRLLYVAATRARDRLYVCGWCKEAPADGSWYAHLATAIGGHPDAVEIDTPDGKITRIDRIAAAVDAPEQAPAPSAAVPRLPAWAAGNSAPPEPVPPRPLVPSRAAPEPAVVSPLAAGAGLSFLRGKLIHRLLQTLPDLAAGDREAAARRLLARPAHALAADQIDEIARETLAVLAHPDFAAAFDGPGLAEAAVVARLGGRALAGRIDRLAVRDDAVYVVDYKTNRPPPDKAGDVAPVYLAQLAAYRAALRPLFPGKRIDCALLWTYAPRLMPIPPELLDAHSPN
jgi:ATP-dependent helicase/nuclease subunit A